ncbi:MAG TPA: polyhydroxyalkanoate synthesis regulator DNA-binding domain-containing protein [candidate division Zixibacteria bacterium]|nr:polyhydroxyalkanoate synthesis regulator DNA-binding domain-containing protein [candidate division Zixibacteria bacterium]
MKVIKRYRNRRLYDQDESRTITQADLAALVKGGVEVKVIDVASGEDVTVAVLGRVLINETSSWQDVKESQDLFRKIISLGGDKSMSVLKNTVLASIGAFQVTKAKAEKIIDELIKKGDLDKSDRKKAVMELLEKAEKSSAEIYQKVAKQADKTQKDVSAWIQKHNVARQEEIKALEAKVDQLTKAIKSLEKKLEKSE